MFAKQHFQAGFLAFLWLLFAPGYAQDSTSVAEPRATGITAEAWLDPLQVPQNRTAVCSLRVFWQGDLERYEIVEIEGPTLTNLEVVKTASSNWVGVVGGVKQAVKTFSFTLRPKSMGMAYVDAFIVDYRDREFDERHKLVTNRLAVKVIEPVVESDRTGWYVGGALLLLVALASVGGVTVVKRRRAHAAALQAQQAEAVPVETRYLEQLKQAVNPRADDVVAAFSALSKLLRRYLSERYQLSALEMTTQELSTELSRAGMADKTREQLHEVLEACDLAKFAGGHVERSQLERSYTLVEDILSRPTDNDSTQTTQEGR